MRQINVYAQLWEHLRLQGLRTIAMIEKGNVWDYRVDSNEFSIRETFHHTVKAIFEDAGTWFLEESTSYQPSGTFIDDLNSAVDRMIRAQATLSDNELSAEFTFQWGEKTTVAGAIQQNLFHAVGHFSQLRNWVGICSRSKARVRG
ncbi:MAG: hypothetical protein ACXAB4_13485 [Candidatus Hodarchaeales archaeon]|jgi:hypothetical protein